MIRSTAGRRLSRVVPVLLVAGVALAACGSPEGDVTGGGTAAGGTTAASSASAAASPTVVPTATKPVRSPSPSAAKPGKPAISKAGLDYFFSIALGAEYGQKFTVAKKWIKPVVTVRVHGSAGNSASCLNKVIADFNAITATTDLRLTTRDADIELHIAPVTKFRSIEPNYVDGNDGYFYLYWSANHAITSATVLVRSTGVGETNRCHLIREELTQTMGMMRDSDKYPDSIFYGIYGPTPTKYSAIDTEVIRLLYSGAVRPGDDKSAITKAVTITAR